MLADISITDILAVITISIGVVFAAVLIYDIYQQLRNHHDQ